MPPRCLEHDGSGSAADVHDRDLRTYNCGMLVRSRRPEPSLARARPGASCGSLDAIRGPSIESGCRGRYAVIYPIIKAPGIAPNYGMRRAYEDLDGKVK